MKRGIERVHRWNEVYDVFEVALGRSNALNKEGCETCFNNRIWRLARTAARRDRTHWRRSS